MPNRGGEGGGEEVGPVCRSLGVPQHFVWEMRRLLALLPRRRGEQSRAAPHVTPPQAGSGRRGGGWA